MASEYAQPMPQSASPGSPYGAAAMSPWESASVYGSGLAAEHHASACGPEGCGLAPPTPRPELFPWFGGADLLFWTVSNRSWNRWVLADGMPSNTLLSTRDVDPGSGVGFDTYVGRYFGCGRYAVTFNYLHFDPGSESRSIMPGAGNAYVAMPSWGNIGYFDDLSNPDVSPANYTSMKTIVDGMDDYSLRRDLRFQGAEINFWAFGVGGARRVAPLCGSGLGKLLGQRSQGGGRFGHGGFGGPLERPCVGTCQLALMHGFRWFQVRDDFRFAAMNDPTETYEDQFYDSRTRNDLFGYQVGGRFNYCATCRLNLGIGARFGVYGNSVEVHERIGDADMPARYQSADPDARVHVRQTNRGTRLATLGEIDLGGGLRLTDAWTVRGGYRVLGVSGIATTVGVLRHEMFSPHLSARHAANESMILHGAYIGTDFNW